MIFCGKTWKFGDNISTDHITPGRFYHLRSNLEELTKHVFADIAPGFNTKVSKGVILLLQEKILVWVRAGNMHRLSSKWPG